jgi:Uma2 family endonuclease
MSQKSTARSRNLQTKEEYLAFERSAQTKHEYSNGGIIAFAGASRAHNLIVSKASRRLGNQLEGKPCEVYIGDMRVRTTAVDYAYPDVVIVCGEPRFEDGNLDTLLNPTVLIEVLSQSTEARDRGDKLHDYRSIESLQDYLLMS